MSTAASVIAPSTNFDEQVRNGKIFVEENENGFDKIKKAKQPRSQIKIWEVTVCLEFFSKGKDRQLRDTYFPRIVFFFWPP